MTWNIMSRIGCYVMLKNWLQSVKLSLHETPTAIRLVIRCNINYRLQVTTKVKFWFGTRKYIQWNLRYGTFYDGDGCELQVDKRWRPKTTPYKIHYCCGDLMDYYHRVYSCYVCGKKTTNPDSGCIVM